MRVFLALAAVVVLSACSDSVFSPGDLAGHHALIQVNGADVPANFAVSNGCSRSISAGALELTARRGFTMIVTERITCSDSAQPFVVQHSFVGTYSLDGAQLFLDAKGTLGPSHVFRFYGELRRFSTDVDINHADFGGPIKLTFRFE